MSLAKTGNGDTENGDTENGERQAGYNGRPLCGLEFAAKWGALSARKSPRRSYETGIS
jgi:hypothetical protein